MCYPELFPFGLGCFNDPRQTDIDYWKWVDWVIHQDASILTTDLQPIEEEDAEGLLSIAESDNVSIKFH